MTDDMKRALKSYPNVLAMFDGIPKTLWDVFLPDTVDGLAQLEANVLAHNARAMDREKVISVQKLCGFPLRPNASLREVSVKARIQGLKRDRLRKRRFRGR
jgi:hypothetical protein